MFRSKNAIPERQGDTRRSLPRPGPYLLSFVFFGLLAGATLFISGCYTRGCSPIPPGLSLFGASEGATPASHAVRMQVQENTALIYVELGETGVFTPTAGDVWSLISAADGELPPFLDDLASQGYVAIRVPHAPPTYTGSSLLPGISEGDDAVTFNYYSPPSTSTLTSVPVSITRRTDLEPIVNAHFPITDDHSHWEVWWLPPGDPFPIPDQPFRLEGYDWPPPLELRFRIDFVDGGAYPCAGCPVEALLYNGYVFIGPYQAPLRYTDAGGPPDPLVTFGPHCGYEVDRLSSSVVQYVTPTIPFTHTHCLENWDAVTRTFTIDTATSAGWEYAYYYQAAEAGATLVAAPPPPFTVEVGPFDVWSPGTLGLLAVHTPTIAISDTLRETFLITATSTVSPEVMAASASFALAPGYTLDEGGECLDLSSVSILGATSGPPGVYTFTTSYTPPNATPPIGYLWDDGGGAATSVRALGVGSYTLTVTATNCVEALVTDTHTILIAPSPVCTPASAVALSLVNPGTLYVGSRIDLSADVIPDGATKPYTYTIDYGDGFSETLASSADPLSLNHTYAAAGVFTIDIGVWNCDMTEPVEDSLEVNLVESPYAVYLPLVIRQP